MKITKLNRTQWLAIPSHSLSFPSIQSIRSPVHPNPSKSIRFHAVNPLRIAHCIIRFISARLVSRHPIHCIIAHCTVSLVWNTSSPPSSSTDFPTSERVSESLGVGAAACSSIDIRGRVVFRIRRLRVLGLGRARLESSINTIC